MELNILEQIRGALLRRRSEIGTDLERNHKEDLELGNQQTEMIDIAQALEQLDRDALLSEQERRELAEIDRALAKMSTGAFGVCEDCGDGIPPKRLMAVPQARLCTSCQAFEEKQQSRMRNGFRAA